VDPNLDLIKGHGRALVREKIVAASARRLVILVGEEKLVPQLGTHGQLPVEVIPFAVPLCERRLAALGLRPLLWVKEGRPGVTDNGNHVLDCALTPIHDPVKLEADIRAIPGVVGTGLFLGVAETILVGTGDHFELVEERRRTPSARSVATGAPTSL
jgi:ribose 5-phosphate isomerase A